MKVQSNTAPAESERLQGGLLINFNVEKKTKEIDGKPETYFEYEQVKVSETPTRAEIISAIIESRYSKDAQIATLFNGKETPERKAEHDEYQAWRAKAKEIAAKLG